MKTEGRAARVWIHISQPRALGAAQFSDCKVTVQDDRVEVVLDSPQAFRGVRSAHFNFPAAVVVIAWQSGAESP